MTTNAKRFTALIVAIGIIGAGYAAYANWPKQEESPFDTATVTRGSIGQQVTLTGKVVPASDADLAFERPGIVARVNVAVGDRVQKGQILATLTAADAAAQLAQANAGLAAAQARLDAVKSGARVEDVAVNDAQVDAANSAVADARRALLDKIVDAAAKADEAVRGKTDQFFVNPTSATPSLSFMAVDSRLANELSSDRVNIEITLNAWRASVSALAADGDIASASATAKQRLAEVLVFVGKASTSVEQLTTVNNPHVQQSTIDGYKASATAARANLIASQSTLTAGEAALRTAQNAANVVVSQRTLKSAGPIVQDVAAQVAGVDVALAGIQAAQAQLGKAVLRSPITGVVTAVNVHAGESGSSSSTAISVISADRFEIDALASETQVASLHASQSADVTLDAYGTGETFAVEVLRIDPVSAVIDGSSGYPVKLRFVKNDERVKGGMTANVSVAAVKRDDVLTVPRSATLLSGNQAQVLVRGADGKFTQRKVSVGIVTDTQVEVTDGLAEGDEVANFSAL